MRPVCRPRAPLNLSLALALLAGAALAIAAGAAERTKPDKPLTIEGKTLNGSAFRGRLVSYNDKEFELLVREGETEVVRWKDLDAKNRFKIKKPLAGHDAKALLKLGEEMLGLEGGKDLSEKAFAEAVKADPAAKDKVASIKESAAAAAAVAAKPKKAKGDDAAAAPGGETMDGDEEHNAGPKMQGGVQEQFWKPLTTAQNAAAVAELKAFAAETQAKMKKPLQLEETAFFLFYSDLPPDEARKWAGLLDRMQGMLASLFAVKPDVWRGKALIFVFRQPADYLRFQITMHATDGTGTRGMCHTYGDGMVHIAFIRQANELEFAHVLVHESTHGFLHRFMTPVNVPSWANEGLADWVANKLVVREKRPPAIKNSAKSQLQQHKGVGGMFEADHIEGWQYPVAEMLTTFMVEKNKKKYVDFITGIKEGLPWEQSLVERFGMTRKRLLQDFGAGMGV